MSWSLCMPMATCMARCMATRTEPIILPYIRWPRLVALSPPHAFPRLRRHGVQQRRLSRRCFDARRCQCFDTWRCALVLLWRLYLQSVYQGW